MNAEKRRFTRIPFKTKAEIRANDALYSTENITNLSIGGCLLHIASDLEPGTACQIKIFLSGTSSELTVNINGEIIRSVPGVIAIKFTKIDPDSLLHLQNIVRYNASNSDAIEQEITRHPGIV